MTDAPDASRRNLFEPSLNRGHHRQFTKEEDELIRRQANGEMSFTQLLAVLRSGKDTVRRRAIFLGVELHGCRKREATHDCNRKPEEQQWLRLSLRDSSGENPCLIGDDALLKRLQREHGDRRYEEIALKRGSIRAAGDGL